MQSINPNDYGARGSLLPPLLGGPPYNVDDRVMDVKTLKRIIRRTPLHHHLLIRGLGALVSAGMLKQHHEFLVPATMMLHVAMDASFELVRNELRAQGVADPSALDAGKFIDRAFGHTQPSGKYFSDWYVDRIMLSHTASRFGTAPFAPLSMDDYLDLREQLEDVYYYLIAAEVRRS
jgi:hypothetical protein